MTSDQTTRHRLIGAVLLLAVSLAACSSGETDATNERSSDLVGQAFEQSAEGETQPEAAQATGESPALQDPSGVLDDRKIIRNASLVLEADDPEAVYREVTRIAEAAGGFVAEASVITPTDVQDGARVVMTVRLPATSMTATLDAIEAIGDVLDRTLGSQDVTEQYTDLQAQVRNLQVLETELLDLLRDVRQSTEAEPAELLTVFNQISDVRGQIESLQGRQRLLDDLIGLATVTVTVQQPSSEAPIVGEDGWNVGAVAQRALRTTVSALQTIGSGVVWLLLTIVPLLLIGLVPAWLIWRMITRRQARPTPGDDGTGTSTENRQFESTEPPGLPETLPPVRNEPED